MCGPVAIDDLSLKVGGDNRLAHGLKQAGLEAQLLHLLFCHDMHLHYSAKQNRPPPFAGSSRLRHWLHSSEAPKYGSELLSLYPAAGFCVYVAYMCGKAPRNTSEPTMTNMLRTNFGELRECEVQYSPTPIGQGRQRRDAHIVGYYVSYVQTR